MTIFPYTQALVLELNRHQACGSPAETGNKIHLRLLLSEEVDASL